MPRKAGRRRKKRRGATFFLLLFLVMLVVGFLARRLTRPPGPRYVTAAGHRGPAARIPSEIAPDGIAQNRDAERPSVAPRAVPNPRENNTATADGNNGENLTPADHRALDQLIREKSH